MYRYLLLAEEIEKKIRQGNYRAGEKLPSIRELQRQTGWSKSTVMQGCLPTAFLSPGGKKEAGPKKVTINEFAQSVCLSGVPSRRSL